MLNKEQEMLNELYKLQLKAMKYDDLSKVSNLEKWIFAGHIEELISDHEEIYENLSKYVIFSEENKRWFNTEF